MRDPESAKTLFQLYVELTDTKVDMAVNKAINQVVDQIVSLRHEMHREMHGLKHEVGSRLSSVETALGMRNQSRGEIRNRFYDYAFKAGWIILGSILTGLVAHFYSIL